MLGGVCAGLGHYFNIDPVFIRLFFVVLAVASGSGVLLYFILWLLIPREDQVDYPGTANQTDFGDRARQVGVEFGDAVRRRDPNTAKFLGIALVLAGLLILVQNLHIPWLMWLRSELIWPVLLIVGGAALLIRALRKD
jgi:phage shock protein PspC (stress-responsive transcriptional regulator)